MTELSAYLTDTELARKLNEALHLTGTDVLTGDDIEDWIEGGDAYDKADAAVRAYMGDAMYDAINPTARIYDVLQACLQGVNECTISGMHFTNLNQRKWAHHDAESICLCEGCLS